MSTRRKLAIGATAIVAVTAYLAYLGASSTWQYCVTPEECLADASRLAGSRVRVNGTVAPGTLRVGPDRRQACFDIAGGNSQLPVAYTGLLPDNLAEGRDVVVEGRLDPSGLLHGERILTRCAGKYASKAADTGPSRAPDRQGDQR